MSADATPMRASAAQQTGRAEAWVLGARLDLRELTEAQPVARGPDVYALRSGGYLITFRYGVVVFFAAGAAEQAEWVERLSPFVTSPLEQPECDALEIRVEKDAREGLDPSGTLVLDAASLDRLQIVSQVLAKSTVLAHHERRVAEGFSRVEARAQETAPLASRRRSQELVREIQQALRVQVQTVGRVELTEKPEIVWDRPDLDRLYELLAAEFELRERDAALSRKLELITESAALSLDLIHTRRGLRVEWYIVILILVEIVILVGEMAWRGA